MRGQGAAITRRTETVPDSGLRRRAPGRARIVFEFEDSTLVGGPCLGFSSEGAASLKVI